MARQLLKSHNLFRLGCPKEKKLRRLLLRVEICCFNVDTLGFEPRAFRMRSGCDTTTPCAQCCEAYAAHAALYPSILLMHSHAKACATFFVEL